MTDGVILLLFAYGMFRALRDPWWGILVWTWVSIMNPHKLGWRTAFLPVAMISGGVTLLGLMWTKDKTNPFCTAAPVFVLLLMIWMCITLPFSFYPDASMYMWERVMKIDLMVLVALALIITRQQIMALAWVLVVSIGFYGVKGGIFTVATGGSYRVWGPPESFIEGNNEVALAMIMVIPLMMFIRTQLPKAWMRHLAVIAVLLTAASAIGSQSRGALLAICAMSGVLWLRSRQKLGIGMAIVAGAVVLLFFMPESWTERMNTIKTYEEDGSAMGRINAWIMAWNLAMDNFFGGGYSIYYYAIFAKYAPDPEAVHAAHSIYFQILGEHGFIGLILFLLVWFSSWRDCAWVRKSTKGHSEQAWAFELASMCQVSLVGYAVGGAFLSLSYFDLPYNILILAAATRRLIKRELREQAERPRETLQQVAA